MEQIIEAKNVRDVDTVTGEIKLLYNQVQQLTLAYIVEIGRRLHEVKAMLPHGAWGTWVSENCEFSHSQANNFMRLFDEYGADQITVFGAVPNSQTFGNLPYTKALRLLALPEDDREKFVSENNVEEMSDRELKKAIEERNAAIDRANELENEVLKFKEASNRTDSVMNENENLKGEIASLKIKFDKVQEKERKAKEEIKKLNESPEIPKEVMDKIRSDVKNEASEDAKRKMQELTAELEKAKTEKIEIAAKLNALEKKTKINNPDVAAFKALYELAQETATKMLNVIKRIRETDSDTADKLTPALASIADRFKEK